MKSVYSTAGRGSAPKNNLTPNNYYICTYEVGPELTMGPVAAGGVTPRSEYCQVFNAEDCAKEWTDRCQFIANDKSFAPNQANPISLPCDSCQSNTVGNNLLIETARRKYCTLTGDLKTVGLNVLGTQYSNTIARNYGTSQICKCDDPAKMDQDPVMNQLLDREIGYDIVMNIYRNCMREKIDISNTRLYKKAIVLESLGY